MCGRAMLAQERGNSAVVARFDSLGFVLSAVARAENLNPQPAPLAGSYDRSDTRFNFDFTACAHRYIMDSPPEVF